MIKYNKKVTKSKSSVQIWNRRMLAKKDRHLGLIIVRAKRMIE